MKSLRILAVGVALFAANPIGADQPTPKQVAIRKLIELTGAAQMGRQVSESLMTQLAPAFPSVPAEVWTELLKMFDSNELTDLMVPLYEKHFTLEEIQALSAFYQSPAGQKFVATMPLLMQESLAVGNQWGQEKADELIRKLKERGYEPVKT